MQLTRALPLLLVVAGFICISVQSIPSEKGGRRPVGRGDTRDPRDRDNRRPAARSSQRPPARRRPSSYEDDDDEDEYEPEPPKRGAIRSSGRPSGRSTGGRPSAYDRPSSGRSSGALVPIGYGRGARAKKSSGSSILAGLASSMLQKASHLQEDALGKAQEWRKIVKGRYSSKFEVFMLQLTWPDDRSVDQDLTESMINFLNKSDDEMGVTHKDNPYRRAYRKLWGRLQEKDYRTTLKALNLLHHMGMELWIEPAKMAKAHLYRMRKEIYDKARNNGLYFSPGPIKTVTKAGEPYVDLIEAYRKLTFARMVAFDGGMGAVNGTIDSTGTSERAAVKLAGDIEKLIQIGTKVELYGATPTPVTDQIIQLVRHDMVSLLYAFNRLIKKLAKGEYSGPRIPAAQAKKLISAAQALQGVVGGYLKSSAQDLSRKLGKKDTMKKDFENYKLDPEVLSQYTASVEDSKYEESCAAPPASVDTEPAAPEAGNGKRGIKRKGAAPPARKVVESEEEESYDQDVSEEGSGDQDDYYDDEEDEGSEENDDEYEEYTDEGEEGAYSDEEDDY